MAADITSPATALQAATLLVPKAQQDANPFFSNAARHLMSAALLALILQAPGRWTLRHLLLVLRSESLLRLLLDQTEFTRPLLQYGEHPATFQNILSTLLTRTAPFELIAAAWDRAEHKLSLRAWLDQEAILILANDEDNRAAIDTINQLLFKRLSELVLAREERPEGSQRTTWFFLDEVRQAGRLDGLSALMTKGRSKGAAVLLGFQDIHGLHDVYGREAANELVGQCTTKVLLRLNSPETARWASQLFGSSEFLESRRSHSQSRNFRELGWQQGGSSGESISNALTKRDLILDSEFLDLPETSLAQGLTGFCLNPLTGAFQQHLPPDWLRQHLCPPDPATPNLIRRPEADQFLRPWSDQDAGDLGLPTGHSP
jgi:type IV secretory pathway TraG/TraD family ATPase VirD4